MRAYLFLCYSLAIAPLAMPVQALATHSHLHSHKSQHKELIVNNRLLATVNDHPISVLDVMKKMDLYLDKHHPEVQQSVESRFQFYSSQWREFFKEIVKSELILADAASQKDTNMKVNEADVRQEIQERFQPNVMEALDRLGLSYEEARKMIHDELLTERMLGRNVQAKAYFSVTPKLVEIAYSDIYEKVPPQEEYIYQVVTVRAPEERIGQGLAEKAREEIILASCDLESFPKNFKEKQNIQLSSDIEVGVSKEYRSNISQISDAHKEVLLSLKPGEISAPTLQKRGKDETSVYRIFHLKQIQKTTPPSFNLVYDKLRGELIEKNYSLEMDTYLKKLYKTYGYDPKEVEKRLPANFQPFNIQ